MLKKLNRTSFSSVYKIMEHSFPIDEHRPYEEQIALFSNKEYEVWGWQEEKEDEIKGFLAVWDLGTYLFVEHFAITQKWRNQGLGSRMLRALAAMYDKRICLEVELPENEITKRRIAFYERNGFSLNEYDYMQPALSEGQEPVPLLIMATGEKLSEKEFLKIKNLLYEKVYGVSQNDRRKCNICPRECNVDRKAGQTGYCGVTGTGIFGARAALHMWEEPCISGEEGSGTVFFSGCPLRCVYCQNYNIAHAKQGTEITIERLSEIFLELQEKKANNINLVTPTHYSMEIKQAILMAKEKGLAIPVVYNCSGYEKVETLRQLDGIVDVYLTDFKYMDSSIAKRYSHAPDYPEVVKDALGEMVRQCGKVDFDDRGMMRKGVIVRHLLLPGQLKNGKNVVKYVYETYGDTVFLSLMNQYTPLPQVKNYPELRRRVTEEEYDEMVDYAILIGVENGFIQEGETAEESFIPPFDSEGWEN